MKRLIIPAMLATGLMLAQTTPPAQDPGQGQTKTTKKAKKSKKTKKDQTSTDSTSK